MIDFEQDSGPNSDALLRVTKLAGMLAAAEKAVEDAKTQLEKAVADFKRIEQDDLPDLMRELGVTSIKLADGSSVEIVDDVHTGISEERRADAHAWLTANKFDGIIKSVVMIPFDREEVTKARKLVEKLQKAHPDNIITLKEQVHPQTLKSFVKERLAAEAEQPPKKGLVKIPRDHFAIVPFVKAKVTQPKGKKIIPTKWPKVEKVPLK